MTKKEFTVKPSRKGCVFTILNDDLCFAIKRFLARRRNYRNKRKVLATQKKTKLPEQEIFKYQKVPFDITHKKIVQNLPQTISLSEPDINIVKSKKRDKAAREFKKDIKLAERMEKVGKHIIAANTPFPPISEPELKRKKAPTSETKPFEEIPSRGSETEEEYMRRLENEIKFGGNHATRGFGGIGRTDVPNPIDSDDINAIAKTNLEKNFWKGTPARDQIKNVKINKTKPFGFIFNTDKKNGKGLHWRAIYVNPSARNRTVEYFDSFGEPPEADIRDEIDKLISTVSPQTFQYKINRVKTQDESTKTCGWHAMKFLYDRSIMKQPFKVATHFNESDIAHTAPPFAFI
jgi:hypothetical protein